MNRPLFEKALARGTARRGSAHSREAPATFAARPSFALASRPLRRAQLVVARRQCIPASRDHVGQRPVREAAQRQRRRHAQPRSQARGQPFLWCCGQPGLGRGLPVGQHDWVQRVWRGRAVVGVSGAQRRRIRRCSLWRRRWRLCVWRGDGELRRAACFWELEVCSVRERERRVCQHVRRVPVAQASVVCGQECHALCRLWGAASVVWHQRHAICRVPGAAFVVGRHYNRLHVWRRCPCPCRCCTWHMEVRGL